MKKIILNCIGILFFTLLLASCGGKYIDGTYTGSSMAGMHGEFALEMTVENGKIADIHATVNNETEGLGTKVVDQIFEKVLKTQGGEVDAVSGASKTSAAVIEAIAEAVGKAAK